MSQSSTPPSRKYVIGLVGEKGSGKDTVCRLLQEAIPGSIRLAFADALKVEVFDVLTGVEIFPGDQERLYQLAHDHGVDLCRFQNLVTLTFPEGPDEITRESKIYWIDENKVALRPVLQHWGTEVRRDQDVHYWINRLDKELREAETSLVIITDVRFPNEGAYVEGIGGELVLVYRLDHGRDEHSSHVSEKYAADCRDRLEWQIYNPGDNIENLRRMLFPLVKAIRDRMAARRSV